MFCTYSLNVTVMVVRLVTVESAIGNCLEIVGAITFVGGIVIVTVDTGEVPRTPFASVATAVRRFVPNGAVHTAVYGGVASLPNSTPFA